MPEIALVGDKVDFGGDPFTITLGSATFSVEQRPAALNNAPAGGGKILTAVFPAGKTTVAVLDGKNVLYLGARVEDQFGNRGTIFRTLPTGVNTTMD